MSKTPLGNDWCKTVEKRIDRERVLIDFTNKIDIDYKRMVANLIEEFDPHYWNGLKAIIGACKTVNSRSMLNDRFSISEYYNDIKSCDDEYSDGYEDMIFRILCSYNHVRSYIWRDTDMEDRFGAYSGANSKEDK